MKPFTIKVGGEAGYGIMSTGLTFSKIATRSGYSIFSYAEYPSIIRGGHNMVQLTVAEKAVAASYQTTDLLVALNQETIDFHFKELVAGSVLIYDGEKSVLPKLAKGVYALAIPLNTISKDIAHTYLLRNTVALGASVAVLGGSIKILQDLLNEEFAHKSPEIKNNNLRVAQAGYDYVKEKYADTIKNILTVKKKASKQMVITGDEAIALGAVAAGLQFAAIYPMTPISNILHVLAALQEKYNFIYKQPEDEISAINMAIGASFAGARSMTASAGGGFCLMSEGYGLAAMTETPLVIIEGMRGGPATGLPTWTEQGDLRFVLHAHQGEFPRIVLAAGDAEEAFHLTMQAFNLADKYQTPVILMVDKQVCESGFSVPAFEYNKYRIAQGKIIIKKQANYKRYALSADGVSVRSIPGVGNHIVANSDEHNELGYSNEAAQNRLDQMNKRMQKLQTCARKDMPKPILYGPKNADLTIVSWGSNKGAILEALDQFKNVNFLHITWISPFPTKEVADVLHKANRILSIECNSTGQMTGLIKEQTGIGIKDKLLKYDGRPFYPEEIIAKIKKII
ncbi:MAG: 2-oxoacid:acceptor oxidoreductase subunit alpha [Candidatus Magasanikbacteria bacterium]|nr:2-oxoacid:acceptor oxidoreductase subunit alpha [Candidatus Magasanikbacteria bacterium]